MGLIKLLDESIYNLLSAGEVVENPASIVKELVENSIDAGAKNITVMINEGGIKSIYVIDDGCGIEKDDIEKTILPHATSKITCAKDLDSIATLGFRGEALSSIAAVSKVEIKSKFLTEEISNYIKVEAGHIIEKGTCSLANGTSISVSSLFYNTPARFKFLKPPKGEALNVTKIMREIIVTNPDISFKYIIDGECEFFSDGSGIDSALTAVFGDEVCDNLLPIEISERAYTVKGFVGRPTSEAITSSKNKQIFSVNGRTFSDATLSTVIQKAYGNHLMTRTFPIVVIDIVMPFDEVDVNIHPSKKEVKFAEWNFLKGLIYNIIKKEVDDNVKEQEDLMKKRMSLPLSKRREMYMQLKELLLKKEEQEKWNEVPSKDLLRLRALINKYKIELDVQLDDEIDTQDSVFDEWSLKEEGEEKFSKNKHIDDLPPEYLGQTEKDFYGFSVEHSERFTPKYVDEYEAIQEEETLSGIISKLEVRNLYEKPAPEFRPPYRVIGQLFDTYLLVETPKDFYMIDQHAAHESILYHKLIKEVETKVVVQDLVIPYTAVLEDGQIEILKKRSQSLERLGFKMNIEHDHLELTTVPYLLKGMGIEFFLYLVTEYENEIKNLTDIKEIDSKLAQMACHSAIKGGERLDKSQIQYFMNYIFDNYLPMQCPHGRPTARIYSKSDVEKSFKR